ncbi:MAG: nicotinamide mononucleotide deamidase-related protein [Candidatus Bathyarchaeota archaeon]|nr:MAG: nicotinamide mononucleotide deamidase-related protein [Candidatus Bathyarchaeota archaeon]
MNRRMEMICIGNELLIGKTLNTNANWLAGRVTALGGVLKRITTVGDEIDEIKMAVNHALQRRTRFIIITGGLGPTHDDMTLKGVAEALDLELVVDEKALEMVKAKYEAYFKEGRMDRFELTPSRIKMATIPEGAEPLPNPVGTAPGVIIDVKGSLLIALPGVPSEMKAIFEESVKPLILENAGEGLFFEKSIFVDGIMESALAPLIDEVIRENPYVYVKSHPKGEERIPHIEIHFSTLTEDSEVAERRLEKAVNRMLELTAHNR